MKNEKPEESELFRFGMGQKRFGVEIGFALERVSGFRWCDGRVAASIPCWRFNPLQGFRWCDETLIVSFYLSLFQPLTGIPMV